MLKLGFYDKINIVKFIIVEAGLLIHNSKDIDVSEHCPTDADNEPTVLEVKRLLVKPSNHSW